MKAEARVHALSDRQSRSRALSGVDREGLSEVFSTLTRRRYDRWSMGACSRGRVDNLVYSSGVDARSRTYSSRGSDEHERPQSGPVFYAQAWLLVHYLTLGRRQARTSGGCRRVSESSRGREPPAGSLRGCVRDRGGCARDGTQELWQGSCGYYRLSMKTPVRRGVLATREMPVDEVAAQVGCWR